LDDGDDVLGESLELLAEQGALALEPLLPRVFDEAREEAAHVVGALLLDLRGDRRGELFAKRREVALGERAHGADLFGDALVPLGHGVLAAGQVFLERADAIRELFGAHGERATAHFEPAQEQVGHAQPFVRAVVDQHAQAVVPEQLVELLAKLDEARARFVAVELALGADEQRRRARDDLGELLLGVREHLFALSVVEGVGFVDGEDDAVAASAQQFVPQKASLALFEDLPCVEQEHHGVGAGNVPVRDLGPLEVEVVDARGVDEGDSVLEHLRGVFELDAQDVVGDQVAADDEVGDLVPRDFFALAAGDAQRVERALSAGGLRAKHHLCARLGAVAYLVDERRRGRDPRRENRSAEQRVYEGALAVVELAEHHQHQPLFAQPRKSVVEDAVPERGCARSLRELSERFELRDKVLLGLRQCVEGHSSVFLLHRTFTSSATRLSTSESSIPPTRPPGLRYTSLSLKSRTA
jgi:hypothetical protein